MTRTRIGTSDGCQYDVRGGYRWFTWRWARALRRRRLLRCTCSDGRVRLFNSLQITWAMEL